MIFGALRRGARRRGRIVGISMVRNEADVVRISVLHQLSLGLDEVLVVDNGSTDGTDRILAELGRREAVRWSRDDSGYRQSEIVTGLAREAYDRGAAWVVPFDADELWVPVREPLRRVLSVDGVAALEAPVLNFVQSRRVERAEPAALRTMTRRVAAPVGPIEDAERLVETHQIAFVEMLYPPKVVARARRDLVVGPGNHWVSGDEPATASNGLVCVHAPLRSRSGLEAKAENGRRADEAGHLLGLNWHLRRWARLADEGRLEAEWRANSYGDDGRLEVGDRRPLLAEDRLLADLVRRFL